MQLVGQNEVVVAEGSSKDSPQSVSEGDVPPGSPSSPSSPSKSNAAAREKPVKVLPCPRCESMNTKFCYYNNYSVTQPRHFCRQCQRYWTAGGTLRNVPVGGGSRKKNRHPRGGEPYLQRPPNSTNPSGPPPFGVPASGAQTVNVGFQQMLSQDMVPLNFAQLPGFPHQYYGLQENHHNNNVYASMLTNTNNRPPQPDLPPAMHAMYGTGPMTAPMANAYYVTHEMAPPSDNVKPELWPNNSMPPPKNGRFEQLNLRLNNNRPGWDNGDVKPKNGSPPHGSSTIEEEGSTPTNGYSNNGYEEGDTVSSMWHSLHDDNMFHDTMFQLNGDDHRC